MAQTTSRQGTIMGTAAYMAPEQAQGLIDRIDERTDVFALGVILYEILSGKSPFRADSVADTLERVAKCQFKPLREWTKSIPRPLAAICAHAMQLEQSARYATAKDMAADLERYLAGGRVHVYRESLWERFDRIANNHRGLFRTVFAAALLVALTAILAVAHVTRARRAEKAALVVAVDAKTRAEASYAKEQAARHRTQLQLAASRESADRWLIDLSGDLQFYPGMASLRASLINEGLEHYAAVLESAKQELDAIRADAAPFTEDQLSLVSEIAFCQIRLGDLARLQGDPARASHFFVEAQSALVEACKDAEALGFDAAEARIQMANASIGLALAGFERGDEASEIAAALTEAQQVLNVMLSADPACSEARNALTRARLVAARVARSGGRQEEAAQLLTSALVDAQILVQQIPGPRSAKLKTNILQERAKVLYEGRSFTAAASAYRELIAFHDQQLQFQPDRPDLLEARSLAKSLFASCLLGDAYVQPALEAYDGARADLDRAWDLLYGEEFYRENQAVLAANQGIAEYQAGRYPQAEQAVRQAIGQLRWLIQSSGVTLDRVQRMARCYEILSKLLLLAGSEELQQVLNHSDVLIEHLQAADEPTWRELRVRHDLLAAELAIRHGRTAEADALLASLASKLDTVDAVESDGGEVHNLRGRALLLAAEMTRDGESVEQAVGHFYKAIESDRPATTHIAYRYLLQLQCEGLEFTEADPQLGLITAARWTSRSPHSAEAWHWMSEAAMLNGQLKQAENALQRCIQLKASQLSIEDSILKTIIAQRLNSPDADLLRMAASRNAGEQPNTSQHRRFLMDLMHGN